MIALIELFQMTWQHVPEFYVIFGAIVILAICSQKFQKPNGVRFGKIFFCCTGVFLLLWILLLGRIVLSARLPY